MGSFVVSPEIRTVLDDRDRLRVLTDLALIDADKEAVFNHLTRFAGMVIGAPISLMTMVGGDYQFFKSAYGIDGLDKTPLSHSFCKHVVGDGTPLVVEDARLHPVLHDNGAIKDFKAVGYMGFPLKLANSKTLGTLCVADVQPHDWKQIDIDLLSELSEVVKDEIEARALVHQGSMTQNALDNLHTRIIAFIDGIALDAPKEEIVELIRTERKQLFG